jgi:uncharacterized membrane protein
MLSIKVCTVVGHSHSALQWYKHQQRSPHNNYHNKTIFITMTVSKKPLGVTHLFTVITILWLMDIGIRSDSTDSERS